MRSVITFLLVAVAMATQQVRASEPAELSEAIDKQWEKFFAAENRAPEHPLRIYGEQLLALAKEHPSPDVSLVAACFLIRFGSGAPGEELYEWMTAGMQQILRRHKNNPHLTGMIHPDRGGLGALDITGEMFLRDLLKETNHRTVRAGAAYALARRLDLLSEWKFCIDEKPQWLRFGTESIQEYLKTRDAKELRREAKELCQMVIDEYASEQPTVCEYTALRLDFRFAHEPGQESYGKLAERLLFGMEHLGIGCQAPEIVGQDAAGETFRLSDYRGKVVLLMFSFKGCGPCEAFYPFNRSLLEHFDGEPFAVLGVMVSSSQGETVQSLRDSMKTGEITWRCWWDGEKGPIATRWDIEGYPTIHLIDAEGVIRPRPGRHVPKELRQEIASLIKERKAGDKQDSDKSEVGNR